jgi:Flp pilus assembly CpaE family ATPase
VQNRYDTVIVDLPEVINDATEVIVTRAKAVYVVCTPEVPSVFLARRRIRELEERGVPASRVGIVVNRHVGEGGDIGEIEWNLDRQVAMVLPNDYFSVREAILQKALVSRGSDLGKAFHSFARILAGAAPPSHPVSVREMTPLPAQIHAA